MPSTTESVCALGAARRLIARTRYCSEPADATAGIAAVGGTKNPDLDAILALKPDLVLGNAEENRAEDLEHLAARVPTLVQTPRTVAEAAVELRVLASRLGAPGAADPWLDRVDASLREAAAAARGRPPLRVYYAIWRKPWMTVNADTFAHALLGQAGGVNVFAANPTRYPEITTEELAAADPDLVLLCTEPFPFQEKHVEELVAATGLPEDRFRIADGEYLSWHGSRTPDGIDYAERLIRGVQLLGHS